MNRGWQSGWQQGQPPPQVQLWWWGAGSPRPSSVSPGAEPRSVRIGDLERDTAVSELGDHFAAGRLTREEFDERADQAMQARFSTDLEPLFADLPRATATAQPTAGPRPMPGAPPWLPLGWLLPVLVLGAVAGAIILHAPFLIWALVWVLVIGKLTRHKRRYRRSLSPPAPWSGPPR